MKTIIYSVASCNHLHKVRTLMESVKRQMPDAARHILILDPRNEYFDPKKEDFEITFGSEIGISNYDCLCFSNSAIALACMMKSAFGLYLLQNTTATEFIYCDSDIYLYAGMDCFEQKLREYPIVLTPHILRSSGPNRLRTDELRTIGGNFNAGMFGFARSADAEEFLLWWLDKQRYRFRSAPFPCYDQRWLDSVPILFPGMHIFRDFGYNVAFWNLDERELGVDGDRKFILCGGIPLVAFHFSGLRHKPPYRNPGARSVSADCEILINEYIQRLLSNGADGCVAWPYAFDRFDDGTEIFPEHRNLFHAAIAKQATRSGSPFDHRKWIMANIFIRLHRMIASHYAYLGNLLERIAWKALKRNLK